MSIFSSYFWLWSIIGLLAVVLIYSLGSVVNMAGFFSPVGRLTRWLDDAPLVVKVGVLLAIVSLIAYPSVVHRLWADATAHEVRSTFERLPAYPAAERAGTSEVMTGLYDPTGAEGTYVIGWYGTTSSFAEVRAFFEATLAGQGWTIQPEPDGAGRAQGRLGPNRVAFRDHPSPERAHYELLVAPIPPVSREVPPDLQGQPTVFALRLGVVDPRVTTQVAWFIDCLVHRAPSFPTCEPMGWSPLERATQERATPR